MSKFITAVWRITINLIPIVAIGFMAGYTMAWWTIAPIAFVFTALKKQYSPLNGFLTTFTAGFLLWLGYASVLNYGNNGVLAARIGSMLAAGNQGMPPVGLLLLTGLIGGLMAGLAGITGVYARELKQSN